jgi:hypothetical protein
MDIIDKDELIKYNEYFDQSDLFFFKLNYNLKSNFKSNKIFNEFELKLFDKYPSIFVDKWIKKYGFRIRNIMNIIKLMKNGNYKSYHFFCYLIDKNVLNINKIIKILIDNELFIILKYINIYHSNKIFSNKILLNINKDTLLLKLQKYGFDQHLINKQLISIYCKNNDIQNIQKIINITDNNDNKLEYYSLCDTYIFNKLCSIDKLNIKNKKKILSYSIINKNLNLVTYLIENNVYPANNSDFLKIFGLHKQTRNSKKNELLIFKNYNTNPIEYYLQNENYLIKIINLINNKYNKIKYCNNFIAALIIDGIHNLAFELIKIYNVKLKIKKYDIPFFFNKIIIQNNPELLKKVLMLNIISTEKFNKLTNFISFGILSQSDKSVDYMITQLKMKPIIKLDILNKNNIKNNIKNILNYCVKYNIPIDNSFIYFISYGDLKICKFIEKHFNRQIKLSDLYKIIYTNYDFNLHSIQYYFKKLSKNNVFKIVDKLLSIFQNHNIIYKIIPIIIYLLKDIQIIDNTIINKALDIGSYDLIIFFHKIKKIQFDHNYNYENLLMNYDAIFDIIKYIKNNDMYIFNIIKNIITNDIDMYFVDFANKIDYYILCKYTHNYDQITSSLMIFFDFFEYTINYKITQNNINYIVFNNSHITTYKNFYVIIHEKQLLTDDIIIFLLEKYDAYDYINKLYLFVDFKQKKFYNYLLYILNKSIYTEIKFLINVIDIMPSPYTYTCFIKNINLNNNKQYILKYLSNIKYVLTLLYTNQKSITQFDYDCLIELFDVDYVKFNKLYPFDITTFKFNIVVYEPYLFEIVDIDNDIDDELNFLDLF